MNVAILEANELEAWFDHLASVFESTGRDYFVRHWNNDPNASLSDIFVARDSAKNIVSTVKVYRREFYFDGKVLTVGGIGEVSTKPEFRSQGLARRLLDYTLPLMTRAGIYISGLSASKARTYYEHLGWKVIPYHIASQTLSSQKILQRVKNEATSIAAADFSESQATQLIPIHHSYAEHFNGPHCRSNVKYWTQWIKSEVSEVAGISALVMTGANGGVVGFACFGEQPPGTIIVKDFFVGKDQWARDQGRESLQQLLAHFVQSKMEDVEAREYVVKYPAAILKGAALYEGEPVVMETKESYLYRVFGGSTPSSVFYQRMANNFVFWDVDKY